VGWWLFVCTQVLSTRSWRARVTLACVASTVARSTSACTVAERMVAAQRSSVAVVGTGWKETRQNQRSTSESATRATVPV
jgi:hypothetical protein